MIVSTYVLLICIPTFVDAAQASFDQLKLKLPLGSQDWDYLGTFRLRDEKGIVVTVRLYADDSDAVADKYVKKGVSALITIPNSFDLYAIYRRGSEPWNYKRVLSTARVSYSKVVVSTDKIVTLELRTNIRTKIDPSEDPSTATKRMERANQARPTTVRIVDGIPALKNDGVPVRK